MQETKRRGFYFVLRVVTSFGLLVLNDFSTEGKGTSHNKSSLVGAQRSAGVRSTKQ